MAPEVLTKNGYDKLVDWWSVGAIFFEMLIGYAPFCSKNTKDVCHKIINWQQYLKIPANKKISYEAEDLIKKFLNVPSKRLGVNGIDEIKNHPFFNGFNWDKIKNMKAPFIPKLSSDYDTHYFEKYKEIEPFYPSKKSIFQRKNPEYLGYTFVDNPLDEDDNKNDYTMALDIIDKYQKEYELKNNDIFMDFDKKGKNSYFKNYCTISNSTKKDSASSLEKSKSLSKGTAISRNDSKVVLSSYSRNQSNNKNKAYLNKINDLSNKINNLNISTKNIKFKPHNDNINTISSKFIHPIQYNPVKTKSNRSSDRCKNNVLQNQTMRNFYGMLQLNTSIGKDKLFLDNNNNINITNNNININKYAQIPVPKKKILIDCKDYKDKQGTSRNIIIHNNHHFDDINKFNSKKINIYTSTNNSIKVSPNQRKIDVFNFVRNKTINNYFKNFKNNINNNCDY